MHHRRNKAFPARFALSPIALVAASLLHTVAVAQPADEPAPRLRPSPQLQESIPSDARSQLPTFVEGDRIQGRTDLETTVEGNAELRRGDTVIRGQRLEYDQPSDLARAIGDVYINKAGNIFTGPLLELRVDAFQGFFDRPAYRFLRNDAYGEADRVDFIDDRHSIIRNATYTTCKRYPGPGWLPEWLLRAASISLDEEEETGYAEKAVLSFYGVPILPVPGMSFPLGDKRKTGLLPPTIGLDNRNGLELTLPWYWNIAPNRDATFYPTLMAKRGIDLGAEFRYLEPNYRGTLRGNYMPADKLRDRDRWGFMVEHVQPLLQLPGIGPAGLSLNINRVSDDDYWRDFSRNSASLTQRLLTQDGTLSWRWFEDVDFTARVQRFQILQDPDSPIFPPFNREPELLVRQTRTDQLLGLDTYVEADYTHFKRDTTDFLRSRFAGSPVLDDPNAHRSYLLAQVSRPWQAPGWFVIPKAQVHSRHYAFETPTITNRDSASVTVPTLSLDSGLVLERETSYFGRGFLQTLEPRAFYVYTPYRDQSYIPNYDSGANDFNFATVFTENAFGGNDRIADNNLLTLGATSRLLDPDTSAEAAKFGIAQRLRFKDQRVTLPGGLPVSERLSDLLFGASVNLVPQWSVDATLQYNPKLRQSIRSVLGVRYSPKDYHVITAAYRRRQGLSEQVEIGWQWPLNDLWGDRGQDLGPGMGEGPGRWYAVGRANVSLKDRRVVNGVLTDIKERRVVEGVLGLEYDGGCWLGRIVVEKFQTGVGTSTASSNKRILFQLEFVGLSRLGSNALQSLKQNIPRYQYLREQVTVPSRFSNYD